MDPIERAYRTETFKWDSLTIKERLALIIKWEDEDCYPYGHSNAKKRFRKINNHYLTKNILSLENN